MLTTKKIYKKNRWKKEIPFSSPLWAIYGLPGGIFFLPCVTSSFLRVWQGNAKVVFLSSEVCHWINFVIRAGIQKKRYLSHFTFFVGFQSTRSKIVCAHRLLAASGTLIWITLFPCRRFFHSSFRISIFSWRNFIERLGVIDTDLSVKHLLYVFICTNTSDRCWEECDDIDEKDFLMLTFFKDSLQSLYV